jgi:hypothetical protein
VSSLPALTAIDLRDCNNVTAAGVQALRDTSAAPSLEIDWEAYWEDLADWDSEIYRRLGVAPNS